MKEICLTSFLDMPEPEREAAAKKLSRFLKDKAQQSTQSDIEVDVSEGIGNKGEELDQQLDS